MKFGIRKPSLKKSISARTTGRAKRTLKRAINPFYGKKGMGWINNPRKAAYNKIYRKTTISAKDFTGCLVACIYYPIYWSFLLMWLVCKYTFIGIVGLFVWLINAVIWIVERIINANAAPEVLKDVEVTNSETDADED